MGSLLLRALFILSVLFSGHLECFAQQAPDCAGCPCTIQPMFGETLYTSTTAPACDGTANFYEMNVGRYARFYGMPGQEYTFSLCAESAATMMFIATNTTIPGVITCDLDGCGTVNGPSQVSFVPPVAGIYRIYVFDGSCTEQYEEGTTMSLSITCEQLDIPINDLPCGAIALPLTDPPTIISGDNRAATNSELAVPGIGPAPACAEALYQGADLWYIAVVPPSGLIGIQTEELTICAGAFQLYTATSCDGGFTPLPNGCTTMGFTGITSEPAMIYDALSTGLAVGDSIYIRYWERNANENGTFTIHVFDATPVENDEPCGAIELSLGSECIFQTHYTSISTPLSSVMAPPVPADCGGPASNDVWFEFTVPDPLPITGILVNTGAGTLTNMAMAWYRLESGTICGPGSLTEIGCDQDQSSDDPMPQIHSSNTAPLIPGETIYVRLWSETPWMGSFEICASIAPLQSNDDPCGAYTLQANYGCLMSLFSNQGTTQTTTAPEGTISVPDPTCGGPPASDVWFTATVPDNGELQFDTDEGLLSDAGMAVYRVVSGSCSSDDLILEEIACSLDGSQQGSLDMPYHSITDQDPGSTVYIRIWQESGTSGSFGLCVEQEGPPPGNCFYTLTMNDSGGDGWNGSYVTICVAGNCTDYTVYGSTASVDIGANVGQIFNVSYTAVGGQQGQNSYQITQFGQPVFTSGTSPANGLVYSETVACNPPPAPWTDCLGAAWICAAFTSIDPPSTYQNDDDLDETNQGCLEEGENHGHWYAIRISGYDPPGALAFHLSPIAGGGVDSVNLDFAVWGPYHYPGTGPVGSLTWEGVAESCPPSGPPIRCSYANTLGVTGLEYDNDLPLTEGSNGSGFVRHLDVQPFEIYLLYVDDRDQSNSHLLIEWITPPPAYEPMGQIDCYGQPEPLSIPEATPSLWSIHPNPNSGRFTLTNGGNAALVQLRMIDVGGRIVHSSQAQLNAGEQHDLDLGQELAPGIYQLQVIGTGVDQVMRVMIE